MFWNWLSPVLDNCSTTTGPQGKLYWQVYTSWVKCVKCTVMQHILWWSSLWECGLVVLSLEFPQERSSQDLLQANKTHTERQQHWSETLFNSTGAMYIYVGRDVMQVVRSLLSSTISTGPSANDSTTLCPHWAGTGIGHPYSHPLAAYTYTHTTHTSYLWFFSLPKRKLLRQWISKGPSYK